VLFTRATGTHVNPAPTTLVTVIGEDWESVAINARSNSLPEEVENVGLVICDAAADKSDETLTSVVIPARAGNAATSSASPARHIRQAQLRRAATAQPLGRCFLAKMENRILKVKLAVS
jgi:hypothetical protein